MSTPQIFVSYRRDDTAGYARAIADALGQRLGAGRVFIDVDDIAAGQTFDTVIHQAVGGATVLLVLIGRRWLGPREGRGPRIDDPDDLVRREVASGLAQGLHVVPLLLDGAAMPDAAQLPEVLQPLTRRNALPIDNARFAADLDRLVAALQPLVGKPSAPAAVTAPAGSAAAAPRRTGPWVLGAGLLLLAAAAAWQLRQQSGEPGAPSAPASAAVAARPAVNGRWQAEVTYDWPNAHYAERFEFGGDGSRLQGSASFLRVARPIEDGAVDGGRLRFVTRSTEVLGSGSRETEHRYEGRLDGDELHLTLQTVGSSTPRAPVSIVARRASAPAH
ncbi:MAG: toll/interleukin-1 receptor domain-containing protein [Burkholderiaceae bacterium]|nr:toll/interleukin-1 receptor domain-containing protein [Burkholderiaceae bacterium]